MSTAGETPIFKRPAWFDPKVTLGNVLTVVALLVTLIGGYVNLKVELAQASQQVEAVKVQIQSLDNDNLPNRMGILEATIVLNKAARDKQNDAIVARLDRLQDTMVDLSNAVAGLTATLKANAEDRRP